MKKIKAILTFFSILLVAPAFTMDVDYRVPVSPELEKYSKFKLDDLEIEKEGENIKFSFSLPEKLTGTDLFTMNFKGKVKKNRNLKLHGVFGNIKCNKSKPVKNTKCDIIYNDNYKQVLEVLDETIESEMQRNTSSLEELMNRKAIWEAFSGDPIGVITINKLF